MRVLGVDPGLAETGWAVLEAAPAGAKLIASGLVRTSPPTALSERLNALHSQLQSVLHEHSPAFMALEEMFFLKAAHTVRASLQARGVILLAAAQSRVPVREYNPKQVKSSITGSGAAAKAQMQRMVQRSLSLEEPLRPDDVADAAAIALCHLRAGRQGMRVLERIGGDESSPSLRASPRGRLAT